MGNTWPKAVLMDFYGTLVEEIGIPVREICSRISAVSPSGIGETDVVSYWVKIFAELCSGSYGASFRRQSELESLSLQAALDHFHIPLDARILSRGLSDYRAHPRLFSDTKPILDRCPIPICLVTNIDNTEIQSAVQFCNLHFDYIVTSEDCRSYKPRREVFDKALSLLGLAAAEVLHVGDSLHGDVQGAQNLGIKVLWIDRRQRPLPDSNVRPEYTSNDLNGILEILKA